MVNHKLTIILYATIAVLIISLLNRDNKPNSGRQFDIAANENISSQKRNSNYELTNRLKLFITIFNSNNKSQIKNYLKENFCSSYRGRMNTKLKSKSNYWHKLYKEIGPIDFVKILQDSRNSLLTLWVRGVKSENYFGFIFDLDEDDNFKFMNLMRGATAPWYEKKENSNLNVNSIDSYISNLSENNLFSGTVLIAKKDSIIYHNAYGISNLKTKEPNSLKTQYLLASSSKVFTAVAIALYVERGVIKYNNPISDYLKNYPYHIGNKVTIHHLLSHTSGIELDHLKKYNERKKNISSIKELYDVHLKYLPKMKNYKNYRLPDNYNYSNEGFDLLGFIIENLAERSYFEFVQQEIFDKVGMNNTNYFEKSSDKSKVAQGYYFNQNSGTISDNYSHLPKISHPSGSFYSTALDMYLLYNSLFSQKLIKEESLNKLITEKVTSIDSDLLVSKYGYGFSIDNTKEIVRIGHSGIGQGISTRCEYYPEHSIYVIILSNYGKSANLVGDYLRDKINFKDPMKLN